MINRQKPYRIIISGGGTGGHIYPAIAIADALIKMYPDTEILFVGAKDRMEMQKVPEAGYKIEGLWISGIQRKLTLNNLAFPLKLSSSIIKSNKILRQFKPDVVVGVGGFASGPLLYAASKKKIPTLIQEQNSYAGLTNKLLAKKVQKICVAHTGMEKFFPADKLVITGNPVRKDILSKTDKREEAIKFFGLEPGKKTILVIGGSLGARTINQSILSNLQKIIDAGVQLIWQSGRFYFENLKRELTDFDSTNIKLLEFIREMDLAYAASDIVISRAGALSISELCLVEKPVIFVPSPNVAEDHQTKNAQALANSNAAVMVRDQEAKNDLVDEALKLLKDRDRQMMLRKNIAELAKPEATENISKEIIKLIN